MMKAVEQPTTDKSNDKTYLLIDVPSQQLFCMHHEKVIKTYGISSAKNGVGQKKGSEQTPLGWHLIRAKIGHKQPINTIFVGRRPLEHPYSQELEASNPGRDWILTRIMWLSGLELGKNRLSDCDTMQRYIYIHGCPDTKPMGVPLSHGCIRMRNTDIIELFEATPVGMKVLIR